MKKAGDKIKFHFLVDKFYFPDRGLLKAYLEKQLKGEGKKIDAINYVFCDDAYLLQMNQQYLLHDTLTDIITFELSPKGQALVSDIYISIERVRENATNFATPFAAELLRVVFHGILHLAGYKDKKPEDSRKMREMEDVYLRKFHVERETKKRKD
ncbi:rRNA maturation RNase YbeY [Flavisolibacter nicotianae]|uniref:rRNA maturation RNase YbeY n=1 Tax=Flavisolibacter nicotianae TaxID=2364882 RepID=UPI000EB214FF|nr:rRNA maturation RNase YbeY [Flavisolibacter nicotianae]